MFRSEATVLASLDDLNVVRLYEYVESPSGAAIVMELDRRRHGARDPDSSGQYHCRRLLSSFCRARCWAWRRRTSAVSCTGTTSRRTCSSTGTASAS